MTESLPLNAEALYAELLPAVKGLIDASTVPVVLAGITSGGAWLAAMVGVQKAIAVGVAPFVIGGVLKSVLGAALLKAIDSGTRKAAHR